MVPDPQGYVSFHQQAARLYSLKTVTLEAVATPSSRRVTSDMR
jgi:hypothetical protein